MSSQTPPLFMLMHKGSRKPKKNLGILDIKPCQGRGLRVVQKIGKQDPFIQVEHGVRSQRTKADKNGGQKPRWEDSFKFDLFEGDTIVRVQCLDQNLRDSSMIGQTTIDFSPVLRSYQWDGWFGLTWQGVSAGDVYLEFTYYPAQDIPKPTNPPKPAVHRITLTPAEILNQMKEAEDALPPLNQPSSIVDSPEDSEKESSKNIVESPKSDPSIDSIQEELSSLKLDKVAPGTNAVHDKHYGGLQEINSTITSQSHAKSARTSMQSTHGYGHRHSEPVVYPNGHYYPYLEAASSESLPSPYLMTPSSQMSRMSEIHSGGKLPALAAIQGHSQPTVDRRRSKLIGPRRASSMPQEGNPELSRSNAPSPSPSQLSHEYMPMDHRHSYPYMVEFPSDHERSPYMHAYPSPLDAYPHFPSSPFPPPAPGVEYPVGPAFMMPPYMYSDPSFYDESFHPHSPGAATPTDCR